jgi:hypothetical protein
MTDFTVSGTASRFSDIRKEAEVRLEAVRAEIRNAGRSAIAEASASFFERNPGVHGFRWTQYTPYWMDGEECVFSANEPDLDITPQERRLDDGQQGLVRRKTHYLGEIEKARAFMQGGEAVAGTQRRMRTYSQQDIDRAEAEIAKIDKVIEQVGGDDAYARIVDDFTVISRFIQSIRSSDLELIFGDHVQVFVTKDGVQVEKYDHD